jgi:hypothetical protein
LGLGEAVIKSPPKYPKEEREVTGYLQKMTGILIAPRGQFCQTRTMSCSPVWPLAASCVFAVAASTGFGAASEFGTVTLHPQMTGAPEAGWYPGNRMPLASSPFFKLPPGAVTPRGWVRRMLELEKEGMTGRLAEISPWLKFDKNAWGDKDGKGHSGWEELPYWLKGYGDLGYVLHDETIIKEARRWIEPMFQSQEESGWFGPDELRASINGKPDMWPHMVMLNVLQSYYEYSGDARVIDCMRKYFRWQDQLPASAFGVGYWPRLRMGDNLESIYWLYNRIKEPWLLGLAGKIHANMQDWHSGLHDWHNVNIAQGFRASTVFWMQSHDPAHLDSAERNYLQVTGMYGQFPGGGFDGDENCRRGFVDPRGGIETCGIVEFMHSFEMLTRITGNPVWADRCEEIAFNSFPAAMDPELKSLHYITAANQLQLDRNNKAPGIQNGGTMFSYSPFEVYRCCQHNVSHGWPFYAEELWLATSDRGLCASLYAESEVKAKVGEGVDVVVTEKTAYPFEEAVAFAINTPKPVNFPLYLRIPRWCQDASVMINGRTVKIKPGPLSYVAIDRQWQTGDKVTLRLPMKVAVRTWAQNKDSVSVEYGPLSFSMQIGEKWEKYGKQMDTWPEWELFPTTPWNYGLVLDEKMPEKDFLVSRKGGVLPAQPWTAANVPIAIKAKARKIPGWQQDRQGMVGLLQPSPVKSTERLETITLIPMGAARLRISSFPTIGRGTNAHEWSAPAQPKASPFKPSASFTHGSDTLQAMNDGIEPANSGDGAIQRFTWWDHRGTKEWVQYDFDKARKVSGVKVYWFDDTGAGQCRVPASWKVFYQAGNEWKPVEAETEPGVKADAWNEVKFKAVEATGLRLEVQLQDKYSGGILEWKVLE